MGSFRIYLGEGKAVHYKGLDSRRVFDETFEKLWGPLKAGTVVVDNTSRVIGFVQNPEADNEEEYDDSGAV